MIIAGAYKRPHAVDVTVCSGKRLKTSEPVEWQRPFSINNPATALVTSSHMNHSKTKGANFDDKQSSISNTPDLVTSSYANTAANVVRYGGQLDHCL